MCPLRTPLARIPATRIREQGAITFAEYMRESLYHPELGYYSRADARRHPDYYTNVDVHPIFGRLLARQLAEIWAILGEPEPFLIVEAGAGEGRLAQHILDFAERELCDFYAALRYTALEVSPARRGAQASSLAKHFASGAAQGAAEWPERIPAGCVFSNELLDALPVHRVVKTKGTLQEIFVGFEEGRFCETLGPLSTPAIAEYFSAQGVELLEGQQAEAGLAACRWIEDAGRRLDRGFVLTVDYGHEARELYNERHLRGTLLAYHQHRVGENFYDAPGEQDLTAHVNFTALDLWGRRGGLERTALVSQAHFLMALGRKNEFADLYDKGQSETERVRAQLLLKNLIHPEGMGDTFQVFIQHKGVESPRLTGVAPL